MIDKIMITRRDLKAMLDISDRTVSRLIKSDGFPRAIVAGRWYRAAVLDWLQARSIATNGHREPSDAK